MSTTSVEITAGLGGFLVLFGLMLAVWFLGRDMTKRLRRMRLAEDERVAAVLRERAEKQAAERTARTDGPDRQSTGQGAEADASGAAKGRTDGEDPVG